MNRIIKINKIRSLIESCYQYLLCSILLKSFQFAVIPNQSHFLPDLAGKIVTVLDCGIEDLLEVNELSD